MRWDILWQSGVCRCDGCKQFYRAQFGEELPKDWNAVWLATTRHGTQAHAAINAGRRGSRRDSLIFAALFLTVGVAVPVLLIENLPSLRDGIGDAVLSLGSVAPWLMSCLEFSPLVLLAGVVLVSLWRKGKKAVGFWMLVTVAVTLNPCWYFLNEWIPKYMYDQRGLGYVTAGLVTVPIFLGADLGNLISGGLIKYLTFRGWSLRAARGTTLAVCGALISPVALLTQFGYAAVVVLLLGLAGLGITSIVANYTACQQDLSFANVGVVAGTLGMASNVFAAIANPYIGRYVDRTGDYSLIFVLLGVLPAVSVLAIVVFDTLVHRTGEPDQETKEPAT